MYGRVRFDRDKVLQSGVDLNSIYTTIGAFLGGSYVNDFNRFGRLYRTYIQAEPEFRQDEGKMDLFFVRNSEGKSAPLSAFVNVRDISGPDYINRFNLFRSIEVKGASAPGYSSAQVMDAVEEVAINGGEGQLMTLTVGEDLLEEEAQYFWRVRASNGSTTAWSTGGFTTELPADATPIWVWIMIAIGAVVAIVVIVLIVRTRRPV